MAICFILPYTFQITLMLLGVALTEEIMSALPVSFPTTILQTGKNTTGIPVPESVVEKLNAGKRPLVRVTIRNFAYRSAVAVMDGQYMISLSSENRQAAGVKGGDAVEVTVELDTEPRNVEIPPDLMEALIASSALNAFESSAPSARKEFVRQVEEAKTEETRQRRISKIIEKLVSGRQKYVHK
jgi:DNA-binding protein YbaB